MADWESFQHQGPGTAPPERQPRPVNHPDTCVTVIREVWTRTRRIRLKVRGAASCALRWHVSLMRVCVKVPPLRTAHRTRTRSESCSAAGVNHADNSARRHGFLSKLMRPLEVGAQLTSAEGGEVRRRCLSLKSRSDPSRRVYQTFGHRANVWPTSEWNLPVPHPSFFSFLSPSLFFKLEIKHYQPEQRQGPQMERILRGGVKRRVSGAGEHSAVSAAVRSQRIQMCPCCFSCREQLHQPPRVLKLR